jgi:hypothetical protein
MRLSSKLKYTGLMILTCKLDFTATNGGWAELMHLATMAFRAMFLPSFSRSRKEHYVRSLSTFRHEEDPLEILSKLDSSLSQARVAHR